MARKKQNKLLGWGILGGVALLIVGVFLVSRSFGPSGQPQQTAANVDSVTVSSPSASEPPASAASSQPESVVAPIAAPAAQASAVSSSAPSVAVAAIQPDQMDQQSRRGLVLKLIDQGIFTGVKAIGSPLLVGITPLFKGLDPHLQEQFIALVYVYINNGAPGSEPLQLLDSVTGEVTGSYSPAAGLKFAAG